MTEADIVTITPQTAQRLHTLREQTGVSYAGLLAGRNDVPEGLGADTVANWLFGRSRKARKDHLEYVTRLWEALPRYVFVNDPEAELEEMRELARETGIGPRPLLRGRRREMPEGLTAAMLSSWLADTPLFARRDHLDYALGLWRQVRDAAQGRVRITNERLSELKEHRARTGIGSTRLLKLGEAPPDGLTPAMVTQWLRGNAGTARQDHLTYVLTLWRSLPDEGASGASTFRPMSARERPGTSKRQERVSPRSLPRRKRPPPKHLVPISMTMLKQLASLQEETGISYAKLLEGRGDLPDGLTRRMD